MTAFECRFPSICRHFRFHMNTHRLRRAQSIASINIRNFHFTIGFSMTFLYALRVCSGIPNHIWTIKCARQSHCRMHIFIKCQCMSELVFFFIIIINWKMSTLATAAWLEWVWFAYESHWLKNGPLQGLLWFLKSKTITKVEKKRKKTVENKCAWNANGRTTEIFSVRIPGQFRIY